MDTIVALLIGLLVAAGLYLMVRKSIVKLAIGLSMLGHAINLVVFSASGLSRGGAPVIAPGAETLLSPHADPLPQALVLTAIVIGFGVLAFALVLIDRTIGALGTDDADRMTGADA